MRCCCCSLEREPIPGALRERWMRELFPDVDLQHCTDDNPQEPQEHPQFWSIWRHSILQRCPAPTHVFASEAYGARLAAELGATFVPVDPGRELVSVSGTAIRRAPFAHWHHVPEPVRPYFVRRVAVVGPESAGKTTLARRLAAHYRTAWAHEWARPFYDWKGMPVQREDLLLIVRSRDAAIRARERRARCVLITDTDALTTCVWSEVLFGAVAPEVEAIAATQRIDLTLLLPPDVPWCDDGQRLQPELAVREAFEHRLRQRLAQAQREVVTLAGSWAEKETAARRAIDALLARGGWEP